MKKSSTPVVDHLRGLLAGGVPVDAAILSAGRIEAQITETTKAMASDLETLNRRRKWDRDRKARSRANSTGQPKRSISALILVSESDVKKKNGHASGGQSAGQKKSRGIPLPDDWAPSSGHYIEGQRLGLSHGDVDDAATAMRLWCTAEAHRALSKKADLDGWNACFLGTWLAKAAVKRKGNTRKLTFGDVMRGSP